MKRRGFVRVIDVDDEKNIACFAVLLECQVEFNLRYLAAHPQTCTIRYFCSIGGALRETASEEDGSMADIGSIITRGRASVSELACWMVAELRHSGRDPMAKATLVVYQGPSGAKLHTVHVVRGDGSVHEWNGNQVPTL